MFVEFISMGLVSIVSLFIFFAFFTAAEATFSNLDQKSLSDLNERKSFFDKWLFKLMENPKKMMTGFLMIHIVIKSGVLINLIWFFIGSSIFDSHFSLFIFPIFVITIFLLIGEVVYKIFVKGNNLRYFRLFAPLLYIVFYLLSPLINAFERIISYLEMRTERKGYQFTINELSIAMDLNSSNKDLEEEKDMLKGIVKFGDIDAKEIMTPRTDIIAVNINSTYHILLKNIVDAGFSRIPIFSDSLDNIEGVLYIKDLLAYLDESDSFEWKKLIRSAYFVPESKKINDLLQEFRKRKIHLAVVVDEYGGTSGIVTLEDVIEEIVGEINDEFDDETNGYSRISDNVFIFDGKISINDFIKILVLPESEFETIRGDAETLAGMLLEITGAIPEINEQIVFKNYIFVIESVNNRRIEKIKVTIITNDEKNL